LSAAERLDEPDVACQALLVIGRLARIFDLDRAEQAFERADQLAQARELPVWRSRALHELGTIDMLRDISPRRLLEAREQALQSGALATVALVDGQLAAVYELRFELDLSLEASQRALDAGRRFRLPGVVTIGLLFQAEVHAYRQDRPGMERILAELPRNTAEDPYFGLCAFGFRAEAALVEEDRKRALRDLATAMDFARRVPVAAPSPMFGLWALMWTLEDIDGAQSRDTLRTSWAMVQPVNRGMLAYADAIDLGRRGMKHQAAQAATNGDRILRLAPWHFHYVRRLTA
jgi:hypothetical protein